MLLINTIALVTQNAIDRLVGQRIREKRVALKLSQSELAGRVGVSFQQLQKYERGTNKVAASRLYALAHALGVAPAFFFDGPSSPFEEGDNALSPDALLPVVLESAEHRALIDAFRQIKSVRLRRSIIAMIEVIGG